MLLIDCLHFNCGVWMGIDMGKGVLEGMRVFLEYYNFLVGKMGNFMEKEDEGNKTEGSRHEELGNRNGVEYRKE